MTNESNFISSSLSVPRLPPTKKQNFKFYIKNFKNISSKGLTINCNDSLNCFIGKNGVGKSAVFDAVNFVLGDTYPTAPAPFTNTF